MDQCFVFGGFYVCPLEFLGLSLYMLGWELATVVCVPNRLFESRSASHAYLLPSDTAMVFENSRV